MDPLTGNVRRRVDDLTGLGAARWQRYHNSQRRFGLHQQPFGNGGDWRHNWQFDLVLDRAASGELDMQFIYPSGSKVGLISKAPNEFSAILDGPERARLLANGEIEFTTRNGSVLRLTPASAKGWRVFYVPVSLRSSTGDTTTFERDSAGRLSRVVDAMGHWSRFSYRELNVSTSVLRVMATLTEAPAQGHWAVLTIPVAARLPASRVFLTRPPGAAVAEARFALAESDTELSHGSLPANEAAFDGDPATAVTATGRISPDWPVDTARVPTAVRILALPGTETQLVGSMLEIRPAQPVMETRTVIARVENSDGRAVDYDYALSPQRDGAQVVLSAARYGDGTTAHYEYSRAEDKLGWGALLIAADDPRYAGPAKRIHYRYHPATPPEIVGGTIQAEVNPDTGHPWATYTIDSIDSHKRTVQYSDDRFHIYWRLPSKTSRVAARSDSLGRITRYEYAADTLKPSASVDHAGRRVEWTRDALGRLATTRDAHGRSSRIERDAVGRFTRQIDARGRVTTIERDAAGRVITLTRADGSVHRFTRNAQGRVVRYQGPRGDHTATYDSHGRLATRVTAAGLTLTYTRDAAGRAVAISDSLGRVSRREFNERGLITAFTGPDGLRRTFSYDAYGRKLAETDAAGRTATWTYDALSRVTRHVDFAGLATTYEYSEFPNGCGSCTLAARPTRIVGADGVATALLYDAEGRLLARTAAQGTSAEAITLYAYDADNNLVAVTDPEGRVTRYTYDDERHRLTAADPLGRVTKWAYDAEGRNTSITTPDGGVTRFEYDAFDHRVATTDAAGNTTRFEYDLAGNVTSTTDALGGTTRHIFDAANRRTAIRYADGKSATWEYDAAGRVVREVNADGLVTARTYGAGTITELRQTPPGGVTQTSTFAYALRRLISSTDPLGRTTRRDYDAVGNVTALALPDGTRTAKTYDAQGRPTSATDANGSVTRFEYDAAGNLAALTDARGQTYRFSYDALRRRTALVYPDNSRESWTYSNGGQLATYTTRAGQVKTISYDEGGRPVRETWAPAGAAPDVRYGYDANGRLASMDNGVTTLTYTRDALGRVASETVDLRALVPDLGSHTIGYAFDPLGRPAAVNYPSQTRIQLGYDARNRLETVSDGPGRPVARYGYNAFGRIATIERENNVDTTYSYDAAGQLLAIEHAKNRNVLASSRYTLDAAGRRTAQTREDGITERYGYDAAGQLTSVDYGNGRNEAFVYDPSGNRQLATETSATTTEQIDYATNVLNQYTRVGDASCAYDANGNLTDEASSATATMRRIG